MAITISAVTPKVIWFLIAVLCLLALTGKNDLNLFEWYDSQGVQSGRIVISLAAEAKLDEKDAQVIYFEDAKCFSLSENYDINSSRRRNLTLAIEAESITVDDVLFQHL